ncbi:glycoside hydrolase family 3 protein [Pseudofrankia saprophytica]|uniref:glycoside hydrolase family 3 protein n=1 Tax=Pseudofrankia saprophytica TaxID=298655 RepID=UPI000234B1E8|nr:glycoside hydrolase family 3 N-terminal domain-containing protein [Pseudofrankia saprophytica]
MPSTRLSRTLLSRLSNGHALVALAIAAVVLPVVAAGCAKGKAPASFPYLDPAVPVDQRVSDLLGRMTLDEKVGQMTQADRGAVAKDPSMVTSLGLGSVLSGPALVPADDTPSAWANLVDGLQSRALTTRLRIPLLYGTDSVHGDNNLIGATIFPHNIAMGATRDPDLVREAARVTATETRATGPQWVFAPCLCVSRDLRWGRTYESFGEDPNLVIQMETVLEGLQGKGTGDLADPTRVLATAKHFAGDGDTAYGTSTSFAYTIDQGVTVTDRAHFDQVDLAPYVTAVEKYHVGSIMPSYSSVDWTEDGVGNPVRMSANKELLTDVLKEKIGFDGFLVSDLMAIQQLPGDYAAQVRAGVNAGIDMFMEPNSAPRFARTLLDEVRAGRVPMSRIDDAVGRILTAKFELGLFERPFTNRGNIGTVGSPEHRAVARRAVAASQVLLKNDGDTLPLRSSQRVYVAGVNASDLGNQAGGWTATWQGAPGNTIPGTTILQGVQHYAANVTYSADASAPTAGHDVGVVVIGETPYAEGLGDVGNGHTLNLSGTDRANIDHVCGAISTCVVLDVAGRPQIVTDELAKMDAFVMSWLPGSEGAGVADTLFGDRPYSGRLPVTWPRAESQEPINIGDKDYDPLFPYDYGLTTARR